jgi:hypothetical protein
VETVINEYISQELVRDPAPRQITQSESDYS